MAIQTDQFVKVFAASLMSLISQIHMVEEENIFPQVALTGSITYRDKQSISGKKILLSKYFEYISEGIFCVRSVHHLTLT